jgi:hypothetical protein
MLSESPHMPFITSISIQNRRSALDDVHTDLVLIPLEPFQTRKLILGVICDMAC